MAVPMNVILASISNGGRSVDEFSELNGTIQIFDTIELPGLEFYLFSRCGVQSLSSSGVQNFVMNALEKCESL